MCFSPNRAPVLVPPRPRGNGSFTEKTRHHTATTPAKAGAQLGNAQLADAARHYLDLPNWAPASAGVVFMNGQHA